MEHIANRYSCYCGCNEWQEGDSFATEQEALDWVKGWEGRSWTMGLYSATEAWIEKPDGYRVFIETGYDEGEDYD